MPTDERRYNYRKAPSLQHKIRVIAGNKLKPVQWGITVPQFIAERFADCYLRLQVSGTMLIMESGCKITASDINVKKRFCFDGMREGGENEGVIQWVK